MSNQKSHHEAHLQSELHLTKVENFRLKLEQKSMDEILKEYPQYSTNDCGFSNEDFLLDGETPKDNITSISRDSCDNCYSSLPPQFILNAKKMDKLYDCPSCGSLLFWIE